MWKSAFKKIAEADHIVSKFLKAVFHKFYLLHSWILCPIYSKGKECFAAENWSHESPNAGNIEKEGNHSDETLQREEEQEGAKEERGNNLVDLPPTKPWILSLLSQCRSLLHEINITNCKKKNCKA